MENMIPWQIFSAFPTYLKIEIGKNEKSLFDPTAFPFSDNSLPLIFITLTHNFSRNTQNHSVSPKQLSNRLWKSLLHTIPSQLHSVDRSKHWLDLCVFSFWLSWVASYFCQRCSFSAMFFWPIRVFQWLPEWARVWVRISNFCGNGLVWFIQTTTFDCLLDGTLLGP